jgi:hypothetical protein
MSVVDRYRADWPRIGGVIAMSSAGALALTHRRMSKPQLLSALNMLALLVHQYEEYEDPATSPASSTAACFTVTSPTVIRSTPTPR